MTTTQVDILVSGAGPVGLFFTYQMALRGHTVYCVDPKPSPTDQSRAILITSRTLETLERRGLASDILSESYVASGMQIFRSGTKVMYANVHDSSSI
jgi:2-polyprenyl-6-methoxyphenol hydroxylase-like FAD-dependent oxidoreductase